MQRRKHMIKTVRAEDITWKNVPLLIKFLNEGGRMMNRLQTRLPSYLHRKLSKTVKHARELGLLPFTDFIKPSDKVPITSNYQMFYENTVQVVDPSTGMIKSINNPSDQDKFTYANYSSETMAKEEMLRMLDEKEFKNKLHLSTAGLPIHADVDQRELIMAQNYLLKKELEEGKPEETKEDTKLLNIKDSKDGNNSKDSKRSKEVDDDTQGDMQDMQDRFDMQDRQTKIDMKIQEETSFNNINNLIKDKVNMNNLMEAFLYEKSYSMKDVR